MASPDYVNRNGGLHRLARKWRTISSSLPIAKVRAVVSKDAVSKVDKEKLLGMFQSGEPGEFSWNSSSDAELQTTLASKAD